MAESEQEQAPEQAPTVTPDDEADAALEHWAEKNVWPIYIAQSGNVYAMSGTWSLAEDCYEYQHLDVAGRDARVSPHAQLLDVLRGPDLDAALRSCDSSYDGTGRGTSGKRSVAAFYRIGPGVPAKATRALMHQERHGWRSDPGGTSYIHCEGLGDYGRLSRKLDPKGWALGRKEAATRRVEQEARRLRRRQERGY